ncbi:MAG: Na-translocating system protein MpsC family protein [Planctomycetota bacterium]|jgi:uncharacterized protein YbcI
MMATTDSQDLHAELAQDLQEFWEDYTGTRPACVRVVAGEQTIAVCLERVLTPAEREMASAEDGREMLKELEEHILEQAKPYLQQLVGRAMEQESILAEVHFDVTSGNVLGFFQPA